MKRICEDYDSSVVKASMSGLLELTTCLRKYRDSLILVGGWVPWILLKKHKRKGNEFLHVGSIDIDFVVDSERVDDEAYSTIVEIITHRGWNRSGKSQFSYIKQISLSDGLTYPIQVDFLTTPPVGPPHRHKKIQSDLLARSTIGASLAVKHQCEIEIEGELPDGGSIVGQILMADVVGCVGMKGVVLGERYKEKDAYDIYSLMENYEGGPRDVASAVKPYRKEKLVMKAIQNIENSFKNDKANGPIWVANFLTERRDEEHRSQAVRAYQVVSEFLKAVHE